MIEILRAVKVTKRPRETTVVGQGYLGWLRKVTIGPNRTLREGRGKINQGCARKSQKKIGC